MADMPLMARSLSLEGKCARHPSAAVWQHRPVRAPARAISTAILGAIQWDNMPRFTSLADGLCYVILRTITQTGRSRSRLALI